MISKFPEFTPENILILLTSTDTRNVASATRAALLLGILIRPNSILKIHFLHGEKMQSSRINVIFCMYFFPKNNIFKNSILWNLQQPTAQNIKNLIPDLQMNTLY